MVGGEGVEGSNQIVEVVHQEEAANLEEVTAQLGQQINNLQQHSLMQNKWDKWPQAKMKLNYFFP